MFSFFINTKTSLFLCYVFSPSGSRTVLILVTPAVTLYPAQLPAGATATAINGMKWGQVGAPAVTKVSRSPMAWEEAAIFRGHRLTVALTPVRMEPRTTPTPTLTMAALPPYWLLVEVERAGRGQRLRGTARLRGAAGCWRGHLLQLNPQGLREKGTWKEQAELLLLISSLETAAPTA